MFRQISLRYESTQKSQLVFGCVLFRGGGGGGRREKFTYSTCCIGDRTVPVAVSDIRRSPGRRELNAKCLQQLTSGNLAVISSRSQSASHSVLSGGNVGRLHNFITEGNDDSE